MNILVWILKYLLSYLVSFAHFLKQDMSLWTKEKQTKLLKTYNLWDLFGINVSAFYINFVLKILNVKQQL